MLSDPETRPLLLKNIMVEARPAGANDPPAADVSAGPFGDNTGGGNYSFPAALRVAGNVGIGTTGPETPLMVLKANCGSGALTPVLKVQTDGASGEGPMVKFGATLAQNVAKGFIAYQSTGGAYGGNGKLLLGVNSATDTTDVSASDAKVAIQGDGKVGIGTTSPRGRLEVVSTVPGDVSFWTLSKNIGEVNDAQNIIFAMPNAVGQVNSTAGLRAVIEAVDANNARTGLGFITGQHDYTAERMRITGGGDVGIGTTAPAEKLDVAGNVRWGANTPKGRLLDTGSGDIQIRSNANAAGSQDDVTKPAWAIRFGPQYDDFSVHRAPPSSGVFTQLFRVDNQGRGTIGKLNQIVFLSPSGGDDTSGIQAAITNLPTNGGVICFTPGTYNISSTISVNKDGVKLRGYGGTWEGEHPGVDTTVPVTLLRWTGAYNGGPVLSLASPSASDFIQDLEISDLTIDGGGNAAVGLKLDKVMDSKFVSVHVKNLKGRDAEGANPSTGMLLTTSATSPDIDTAWNHFENCSVVGASIDVDLTKDPNAGAVNCAHNVFVGLNVRSKGAHWADAGIWLVECDNNTFYRTWIQMDSGLGYGVVVADPTTAYSNYFYHLQPGGGSPQPGGGLRINGTSQIPDPLPPKNFVFGYDQANGQPAPSTDSSNQPYLFLGWTNISGEMHGFTIVNP